MMIMPGNHSSPLIHHLATKYPGRIGWLVGPSARTKTRLRHWLPYALDNDAFGAWTKGTVWNELAWLELLAWGRASQLPPLWAIVPDVVADKKATLNNWKRYSPVVASYGWPMAFAVQDGMTPEDVPEDAAVVFVGGTTEWKWTSLPTWTGAFPRVHVGRVNELRRLHICQRLGVESVDGTGWVRDPSDPRKLDLLEAFVAGTIDDNQMALL